MHSKKKIRTLRKQLVFTIGSFLICFVGICLFGICNSISIQKRNLKKYLTLYSSQLMSETSRAYETFENIAYSAAYSSLVQDYIQISDPEEKYLAYQNVYNNLNSIAKLSSFIQDIAVISSDPSGSSISLTVSPSLYEAYEEQTSESGYSLKSLGTARIGEIDCQILAMPVEQLNIYGNSRRLGTAYLAINTGKLFSSGLSSAADTGDDVMPSVVYLDSSGSLIYGDSSLLEGLSGLPDQTVESVRIDDENYMAEAFTLTSGNGTLYVLFESDDYLHSYYVSSIRQFAILIALSTVLWLVALYRWMLLAGALRSLTKVMNEISSGERRTMHTSAEPAGDKYGVAEVRDIYRAYNRMMEQINRLNLTIYNNYTRMYEMEMNNRQTEIAFLRSQINPHFLNNTLTTINGMAVSGQDEKIQEVTVSLSRILQYSIRGSELVALSQEMDIVRDYLMIQSCRFEDRFSVQYSIQKKALDWQIPRMIIQPLVENAIVHGLEPSMRRGKLILSARVDETRNVLVISVMDTGVGMSAEKLAELKQALAGGTGRSGDDWKRYNESHHDSIGLYNVNSRIILYYGPDYAIDIRSWEGAGTNIELTIPSEIMALSSFSGQEAADSALRGPDSGKAAYSGREPAGSAPRGSGAGEAFSSGREPSGSTPRDPHAAGDSPSGREAAGAQDDPGSGKPLTAGQEAGSTV
ncbi:MAG: sensor histidine kinase [Lachnospiraceae bacterium]|jgi:two-component system sensor histidine kinase YesM